MNKIIGVCLYIALMPIPGTEKLSLTILILQAAHIVFLCKNDYILYRESALGNLLAIFLVMSLASILMSVYYINGFKAFLPFIPAYLIYFIITQRIRSISEIRILFFFIMVTSMVISLKIIVAACDAYGVIIGPDMVIVRANSPILVTPNDSIILSIILPFSYALGFSSRNAFIRISSSISAILTLIVSLILHSRSCFFITILSSIICIYNHAPKRGFYLLMLMIFITMALEPLFGMGITKKVLGSSEVTGGRIPLWLVAMKMIYESPIFGLGPNTYGVHYMRLLPSILSKDMTVVPGNVPWAHNLYLEIAAERGLVALGLVVAIFIKCFNILRAALLYYKNEEHIVILCTSVSLGAIILAGFVDASLLKLWVVIVFSIIFGLIRIFNKDVEIARHSP